MEIQKTIFMLENLKMIPLSTWSWKPQLSQKWRVCFPFLLIFKTCVSKFFTFRQNKALAKLSKMLFVSPQLLYWFLQCSNFRRKLRSRKLIIMTSWNGLLILLTLISGCPQRFLWMTRWWSTKEKLSEHNYLVFLKVIPDTFWDWLQKQKTNLDFQYINYISSYLPNFE